MLAKHRVGVEKVRQNKKLILRAGIAIAEFSSPLESRTVLLSAAPAFGSLGRETSRPCLAVLIAEHLPACQLFFEAPLRHVQMRTWRKALAMQGALHPDCNFLLRWKAEKRRFILREADAILRKDRPLLQSFLGSPALPSPTNKDAVVKFLSDSFEFCSAVIPNLTEEQLTNTHNSPDGRLSGREILFAMHIHVAHHRGQAEIYLRDKGIRPPSYRI